MFEVSPRLLRRVRTDFGGNADLVMAVLGDLDLPMLDGRAGSERVQAAVVLFARGDLDRLGRMADLACADWRDALVAAGLENEDWRDRLDIELGSRPP